MYGHFFPSLGIPDPQYMFDYTLALMTEGAALMPWPKGINMIKTENGLVWAFYGLFMLTEPRSMRGCKLYRNSTVTHAKNVVHSANCCASFYDILSGLLPVILSLFNRGFYTHPDALVFFRCHFLNRTETSDEHSPVYIFDQLDG